MRATSRHAYRYLKHATYRVLAHVLDFFGFLFWRKDPPKPRRVRHSSSLEALTDEDVIRILRSEHPRDPDPLGSRVHLITSDTVLKCTDETYGDFTFCPEAEALVLVEQQTQVLSPTFRKLLRVHPYRDPNILMERVQGEQLRILWPLLSLWQKLRVVWTIRQYVRQLHSIKDYRSHIPGPLAKPGDPPTPSICHHILFPGDRDPKFNSILELARHWTNLVWPPRAEIDPKFPVDTTAPLVFCHGDLNMRNIMLDTQGNVWLVDYGFSGFYPPWYEYIGMDYAARRDKTPWLWRMLTPLVGGTHFEHDDWVKETTPYTLLPW